MAEPIDIYSELPDRILPKIIQLTIDFLTLSISIETMALKAFAQATKKIKIKY